MRRARESHGLALYQPEPTNAKDIPVETKVIPTAKEVQAALDACQVAWTNVVLLQQNNPVKLDSVKRYQDRNPDSKLWEVAQRLEAARQEFNAILRADCKAKQARADELGQAFAAHLFKAPIPGPVTLPRDGRMTTVHIDALANVMANADGPLGFIKVSTHGGRGHDTERFFTEHGQVQLAAPDLY